MTSVHIHENPDLFPNPREFSPERWLEPSSAKLRKYLFAFGRGSRICAGIQYVINPLIYLLDLLHQLHSQSKDYRLTDSYQSNSLAHCELYLTLAAVFAPGRFNLELYETDISDAEPRHDFFGVGYRLDSKGIRMRIN